MRIDLHTHSTASDGTLPPGQVMTRAAEAKLDIIALTDHDTTAGWEPAIQALPPGLTFVPGAELSCYWQSGGGPRISLHLLAYLFDPSHPGLSAELARVCASRETRGEQMVKRLVTDDVPISWAQVKRLAAGAPIGRPHIGAALIAAGVVTDMEAAFGSQWLGERYRIEKADIEVFTALKLVREAGGVTVFAHPKATKRGRTVPDEAIGALADAGLTGIEADHADHTAGVRAHVRQLADRYGLVPIGSSDFHGDHKKLGIGDNATTTFADYQRLIAGATGRTPVTG